jgi:hypothetical protein
MSMIGGWQQTLRRLNEDLLDNGRVALRDDENPAFEPLPSLRVR